MADAGKLQETASAAHMSIDPRLSIDLLRERFRCHAHRPIAGDDSALTHAVLVPLYLVRSELHIVLTKRTTLVRMQQGHISFPGGRREPSDADLLTAALRESFEEVGLEPRHVEIFGRIDDFSTREGEILIAGFAGLIDPRVCPYPWRPEQREVAEILEVPVRHLLDPANLIVAEPRELNGRMWPSETFLFGTHRVFGATARALRNVLNIAFASA